MYFRILLIFLLMPMLRAELPPSAYESLQRKASEYLKIEIIQVNVQRGEPPTQQTVHIIALVTDVLRSASGLKPNEILNIHYSVTEHPRGWAGPGEVPIPSAKERSVAYLTRTDSGDFAPAAGRMSFSNF